MYSFLISIVMLLLGYIVYGRIIERVMRPDKQAVTPAIRLNDGVDYIPLPTWKVYMIQFLNIAGTGPIFGAIMGAKFGPACYLWIVLGSIFAGAVHDYFSGMISLRHDGGNINNFSGRYFGKPAKAIVNVVIIGLLLLVGGVFVYSPALILGDMVQPFESAGANYKLWIVAIFIYYFIATVLPIDKIIGKIYPVFAISLLFMAVSLFVCLITRWPSIPEFWQGLQNRGPSVGLTGQNIFPCLFITVACGAISGFHATQCPMMARCLKDETMGRPVFYGAMITEGLVALIWAAVSSYFFFDGGMAEVGAQGSQAPEVVTSVARSWLGITGGILAVIGVVAAPITTGDTALRSCRLIVAEILKFNQKPAKNRFVLAIPIFAITFAILWFNITDENGFNKIWRYFGWINQTLAAITLWTIMVWLVRHRSGKKYLFALFPTFFMTATCITYICVSDAGFNLPDKYSPWIAAISVIISAALAVPLIKKHKKVCSLKDEII